MTKKHLLTQLCCLKYTLKLTGYEHIGRQRLCDTYLAKVHPDTKYINIYAINVHCRVYFW